MRNILRAAAQEKDKKIWERTYLLPKKVNNLIRIKHGILRKLETDNCKNETALSEMTTFTFAGRCAACIRGLYYKRDTGDKETPR